MLTSTTGPAVTLSTTTNPSPPSPGSKALQSTVFGSIAGILGKIIEYPFDTVKVRLQSQPATRPLRYTGPLDCFKQSIAHDGVLSLYRGLSAPLLGAAVETSSLFFSYRLAQDLALAALRSSSTDQDLTTPHGQHAPTAKLPLGPLILCGAASGAFTSLFLTPIELVKCQMQVPSPSGGRNASSARLAPRPLSIMKAIVQHRGFFGFWHGQMGTFIRETGGSAAWFGSYEAVGALFRSYNRRKADPVGSAGQEEEGEGGSSSSPPPLQFYQQLLAGAAAGVSYNFVCFPADTIKSRMQTEEVGGVEEGARWVGRRGRRATFWESGRSLWRQQGLRGMYRGCGITVARSAPSSAVIFAVEEWLQGWWRGRGGR